MAAWTLTTNPRSTTTPRADAGAACTSVTASVELNDRSSIHSNTAGDNGGGVFVEIMASFALLDASSVSDNSPNNVCRFDEFGSLSCT